MNIGILGTGMVGQTIGAKLMTAGHDVLFGTRDVEKTLARTEPDGYGNPPFAEWKKERPGAGLGTFREAAAHGEILFNTTAGVGSLAALSQAGAASLRGKILIDVANPLDASQGFPPALAVCNTDSLGEQIQNAFPETKVVKTLNTMNAYLMVEPALLPGDHTVFLSGDDAAAKERVGQSLAEWFGWKPENILDLCDISTARGVEMLLPIWIRLYGALQTPMFNFNVVK